MLEDSYYNKDTICMKMSITVEPQLLSPRSNQLFFSTPVIVNIRQYEKEPRYKLTNVVITNIFCQSHGPALF